MREVRLHPKVETPLSDESEKPIGIEALSRKGNHFFGFTKNISLFFEKSFFPTKKCAGDYIFPNERRELEAGVGGGGESAELSLDGVGDIEGVDEVRDGFGADFRSRAGESLEGLVGVRIALAA